MSLSGPNRMEEDFQRVDAEADRGLQIGRDGLLRAGMMFAEMQDYGYFPAGGFTTMREYYASKGIDPGFGRKLEQRGRWLLENNIKTDQLEDLSLSKIDAISGMKNPASWIKKAKELSLPDLKAAKTKALHGVEVVDVIECKAGRCVHVEDGECEFGYNIKDKEDKAKAYREVK
jgi:hypothetical protein